MVQQKSIPMCIILSLVTCGIYTLYWMVTLTEDVNTLSGESKTSGVMVLVLSLVTCGIYSWYWLYTQGDKIDRLKGSAGSNSAILYLILCLIGLGIVAYGIMQNEINQLA